MSDGTGIAWTDATWSPILGCTPASRGCGDGTGGGCYALRDVWRMAHNPNPKIAGPRAGLVEKTPAGVLRWTGKVSLLPGQLTVPMRWRAPRRIFVANQSDLFHEGVPDAFIAAVFGVMAAAPRHTFQLLTKRPDRARRWFDWLDQQKPNWSGPGAERMECDWRVHAVAHAAFEATGFDGEVGPLPERWPLPNVWIGTSVEDQASARARIPWLLEVPAALRFVSAEPVIGPVDLTHIEVIQPEPPNGPGVWLDALRGHVKGPDDMLEARIAWVIAGGESGQRARACEVAWVRGLVEQCRAAGVPAFVKQLGTAWAREQDGIPDPKGGEPLEWPEDLRVRQMPEVAGA